MNKLFRHFKLTLIEFFWFSGVDGETKIIELDGMKITLLIELVEIR